jgi:hypothetical protein
VDEEPDFLIPPEFDILRVIPPGYLSDGETDLKTRLYFKALHYLELFARTLDEYEIYSLRSNKKIITAPGDLVFYAVKAINSTLDLIGTLGPAADKLIRSDEFQYISRIKSQQMIDIENLREIRRSLFILLSNIVKQIKMVPLTSIQGGKEGFDINFDKALSHKL